MGVSSMSKSKLNWGQHAELKLQAILFIYINLAKVAKRAKLIRLIDFFPSLSLTLRVGLLAYLDVMLT